MLLYVSYVTIYNDGYLMSSLCIHVINSTYNVKTKTLKT